jgi:hypothetical protein
LRYEPARDFGAAEGVNVYRFLKTADTTLGKEVYADLCVQLKSFKENREMENVINPELNNYTIQPS